MPLSRGTYVLPHQSQATGRDLTGEELTRRWPGKIANGYMLTDEQLVERAPRMCQPYRFLLYTPDIGATSWTAFVSREDLDAWMAAYGLTFAPSTWAGNAPEPAPGHSFGVRIPATRDGWLPLSGDGVAFAEAWLDYALAGFTGEHPGHVR